MFWPARALAPSSAQTSSRGTLLLQSRHSCRRDGAYNLLRDRVLEDVGLVLCLDIVKHLLQLLNGGAAAICLSHLQATRNGLSRIALRSCLVHMLATRDVLS